MKKYILILTGISTLAFSNQKEELFKKIINYEEVNSQFLTNKAEIINSALDDNTILSLEAQSLDCKQFKGFTPLMLAVKLRTLNEVKILVQSGADINQIEKINNQDHSAVSLAFFNNKANIWRYFVQLKLSDQVKEIARKLLLKSRQLHLIRELNV